METLIYVGIDVSKDRLDVHLRPLGESFTCGQSAPEIDGLVVRLQA
ncbi:hypothetical protein SAMN02927928_0133, partial [Asticcacaulis taihuensis]